MIELERIIEALEAAQTYYRENSGSSDDYGDLKALTINALNDSYRLNGMRKGRGHYTLRPGEQIEVVATLDAQIVVNTKIGIVTYPIGQDVLLDVKPPQPIQSDTAKLVGSAI